MSTETKPSEKIIKTNRTIISIKTFLTIVFSSPAAADGKVYVGCYDGKTYCLDAANGAFIWSFATVIGTKQVASSPAVANGVVYIGQSDKVYAFSTWVPIPEGLNVGVMLLLSTVAAIVGIRILRKRPKWKRW